MMNPRRQTASQAVRSVLAALPLVMLSLVQASSAGAAPAPQHDRDHGRGRDGVLTRWEFDCTFDFDDRDHDRGRGRGGRHDRDDGVCEAIAVVYGVDTDDFPAPSGGKEPEIPVTPVVPVPVPISPNRLAVWCDGVGLIYDNAANVANDFDFASVSGYGGTPAVVFDLDEHHSLQSLLNEDGGDGDGDHGDGRDRKRNRIEAELFTGLGLGIDGLDGSCIVRKNGDDGRWDDFVKSRGPVVQSPRRS